MGNSNAMACWYTGAALNNPTAAESVGFESASRPGIENDVHKSERVAYGEIRGELGNKPFEIYSTRHMNGVTLSLTIEMEERKQ